MDTFKGVMVATAVAAMFGAVGCGGSDDENTGAEQQAQEIKCEGGNECAGTSECKSAGGNECKGTNSCAGQGWIYTDSEQECIDLGGMPVT